MTKKPNIVIIMTDQQQARASAREGFPLNTTPFMDVLARKGAWFNKAYTSAPICAPARVSMLTGRYPGAHGVRANPTLSVAGVPRYHQDLIDVLRGQGYTTAMIGKNHSHLTPEHVDHWFPLGHAAGYTRKVLGVTGNHRTNEEKRFDQWLYDLRHGVCEEPSPFPLRCQGPYRAITDAEKWVHGLRDEKPFFMWLTFAEPHNPYQVPEPYFSMFPPASLPPVLAGKDALEAKGFKWEFVSRLGRQSLERYDAKLPRMRSNYYGMLRLIDDQVKRFVNVLEREGILDNIIIFVVSDHGDFVGDYGLMRKGPEMPEDLIRIPFIAVGSRITALSGPHPAHVSLTDIMPTICDAIGAPLPDGVQGRSLWPLLTGQDYREEEFSCAYAEQGFGGLDYTWDDEPDYEKCSPTNITFNELNQYCQCGIMRMLRKYEWKLIYDMQGCGQLYNLEDDPAEIVNLFDNPEYTDIQRRMVEELLVQTLRAQDPLPLPGGSYERKSHPRNYWTVKP